MAITPKDIRDFFTDYSDRNMKHLEEFFTDEQLESAIKYAKQRVELMPPLVGITSSQIPDIVMLYGASAHALQIKINNLSINYTPGINEHGVQLSIGEEIGYLKELQREFKGTFDQEVRHIKQALDIRKAFANIRSPYRKNRGR